MDISLLSEAAQNEGFDIYGLVVDGQCLVRVLVESLDEPDINQLFALFDHILRNGPPKDEKKFRNLGDGIYELKTRNAVRVLCFFGPSTLRRSLILTHGFRKPKGKVLKREIKKAKSWYQESNDIRIVSL